MSKIYEAWIEDDGVTFTTREKVIELKKQGLIATNARLIHTIEADSYDDAMIQHHLKMGWEAYKPFQE